VAIDAVDLDQVPGTAAEGRAHKVRAFDFRRPNKLNRDHVRNLEIIHDTFCGQFSTVLSSSLRVVSSMSVQSVDEMTYDEYVRELPNPTHLSLISMEPLPGLAVLQIPVETTLVFVDLLLGGQGRPVPARPLTEIESSVVRTVVDRGLKDLTYAFESVLELRPTVAGHESNPQFAQVATPSDMVVVINFQLSLATIAPTEPVVASLCYPYTTLQPILEEVADSMGHQASGSQSVAEARDRLGSRLAGAPVELCIEFAPLALSSGEILTLRPGDVLALGHPTDRPLTATVGGVPVFAVDPARKGKRLAVRVRNRLTTPARGALHAAQEHR
jgi:flagellar motor switch protein FliM